MKTVPKGTNRPAAAARTRKHAQRTPLPPKPGVVEAAREPIEDPVRKPYGEMTVGELRDAAKELGIRPLPGTRGDLLNAILEKEREAASRPAKKGPSKAASSKQEPTEAGTRSEAKALDFAAAATSLGWAHDPLQTTGERTEITVRRGDETIDLTWDGGVFQHPCLYSFRGRTIQMRNASAAKLRMAMEPEKAEEEVARVAERVRPGVPKAKAAPRQRRLPFDPELATDEEVLSAVQGKRITWTNGVSGADESDRVPLVKEVRQRANRPKIQEGKSGRILTFPGEAGYRSVLVAKITSVR